MNSLLKRQIRKYLSEELKDNEDLAGFLTSVDRSYDNFDEQSSNYMMRTENYKRKAKSKKN